MRIKSFFIKPNKGDRPSGKKGFTLVEVIITLVITVIVIAVSSALVITGTNLFARSAQRDIQMNIAETVLSFVSEQLLYTNDIGEFTNPPAFTNDGTAILQIKTDGSTNYSHTRGQLFFRRAWDTQDPINVFGPGFYQNYEIGLEIDVSYPPGGGNASFKLTVNVYRKSDAGNAPVLSRTTTKPLLNYVGEAKPFPDPDLDWFCIYYSPS